MQLVCSFVCLLPSHPGTREKLVTPWPAVKAFFVGWGWVVGGVVLGKKIPEFNSRGLSVINLFDRFLSTSQPSLSFKIKGGDCRSK